MGCATSSPERQGGAAGEAQPRPLPGVPRANAGGRLDALCADAGRTAVCDGALAVRHCAADEAVRYVALEPAEYACGGACDDSGGGKRVARFRLDRATLGVPDGAVWALARLTLVAEAAPGAAYWSLPRVLDWVDASGVRPRGTGLSGRVSGRALDALRGCTGAFAADGDPGGTHAVELMCGHENVAAQGWVEARAAAEGVALRLVAGVVLGRVAVRRNCWARAERVLEARLDAGESSVVVPLDPGRLGLAPPAAGRARLLRALDVALCTDGGQRPRLHEAQVVLLGTADGREKEEVLLSVPGAAARMASVLRRWPAEARPGAFRVALAACDPPPALAARDAATGVALAYSSGALDMDAPAAARRGVALRLRLAAPAAAPVDAFVCASVLC